MQSKTHKRLVKKIAKLLESEGYKVATQVPSIVIHDITGRKESNPIGKRSVRIEVIVSSAPRNIVLPERSIKQVSTLSRKIREKVKRKKILKKTEVGDDLGGV